MALFVFWELRASDPVLNVNLFRGNQVFAFSNLAAGLLLVVQPALMAGLSPAAGRLSDRFDPRLLATAGMLLAAVGLLLFAFLGFRTSMGFLAIGLAILGVGFALFSSPNTNAIMTLKDGRFYGMASATLASMRLIGQMLSMSLAMLIYTLYLGQARITPAVYGRMLAATRVAFVLFAALCFGGVFASLARGKRSPLR